MDAGSRARRQELLRALPSVDQLLKLPVSQDAVASLSRPVAVSVIRRVLDDVRTQLLRGEPQELEARGDAAREEAGNALGLDATAWEQRLEEAFLRARQNTLIPVINATGVILHTNLGRAPLSEEALEAVRRVSMGYSNLEYDLAQGRRGSRHTYGERLLVELAGAEAAMVVNNNAAAVLLVLSALAAGGEVIISRGELVEIGGAFRIPDVLAQSGCRLVEVGTTNRTRLSDYARAVGPETKALLKVHTSNFKVIGFTESVPARELASLARSHGLYLIEDLGSGVFLNTEAYGLAHEPTVQEAVAAGADIVTFSGDKLLGGPQAGIILGKRELVERCRRHPLARAVRVDKMTLAALEATLRLYARGDVDKLPIWRMMAVQPETLRRRAEAVRRMIEERWQEAGETWEPGARAFLDVVESRSAIGGGSLPGETLPTWVLRIRPERSAVELAEALRQQSPPVIARVEEDALLLDFRTVDPADDRTVAEALVRALGGRARPLA